MRPLRSILYPLWLALGLAACTATQVPVATQPSASAASETPKAVDELSRPLPVDRRIKTGRLPNGLTYFILPHGKPEKRVQLWLAVDAGSAQEDDDQRGLAHFVEHMAFNGTRRFPKQALVDFLEGIGMKFGPDLNAYTSFDETVFMLQVPTDKPALIDGALDVLRDWASDVAFEPGEIEKERGVVLEEWRLGRGAGARLLDKQIPVIFRGSKYAERLPIGKPEIIGKAPPEALRRYYRDWYRPDLMAVIAVGDVSAEDLEKRITQEFSGLAPPREPRPRPTVPVPPHDETLVSIETDPEMPSTSISVFNKIPHRAELSAADYRRFVAEQLYHQMVNARLDELRRRPDAPFLAAFSSTSKFVRDADLAAQSAAAKEGQTERALEVLLEESQRIERHGFTAGELDRAKKGVLRQYQQAVAQRDKNDSRQFAAEIVRHFLQDEAMPGIEAELALVERFLPTFTLTELNGLARAWREHSQVIVVNGPEKMKKPTAEALLAIARSVESKELAPYQDVVAEGPLLASPPKPGSITATRAIPEIGVTEWKLSNGARVVLKPTEFKNDEVLLRGWSPGGHSLVKDRDFDSARFSDEIVREGGLGQMDPVQLRKTLTGKIVSLRASVGELEEGLSGHASPADLESLLQLLHLSFTSPRRDEKAFQAWRAREIERARNRRLSPEGSFFEEMQVFASQNHRRRRPTTPETLARVDLDRALAIYRDRFADAGDFTFAFVGDVDPDRLRPLVELYLASLPAPKRKETWRDVKVRRPAGVKTKVVTMGNEPKSMVFLAFHGKAPWSRETENDIRTLGEALRIRLREVLREDMGGVYGVSASGAISRRPRQEFTFTISFGCAPENVDKLKKAIFDEIAALHRAGIGDTYIAKIKEARVRSHELSLKDNGFWARELTEAYSFGDDPRRIPELKPLLDAISSEQVKTAAQRYLTPRQYLLGVLKPAAVPSAPASAAAR